MATSFHHSGAAAKGDTDEIGNRKLTAGRFATVVRNFPEYVVTIKYYNRTTNSTVTVKGILMDSQIDVLGNKISLNSSGAANIEAFLRGATNQLAAEGITRGTGMIKSLMGAGKTDKQTQSENASKLADVIGGIRDIVLGGLQSVASTAQLGVTAYQPKFNLKIFVDLHSSVASSGVAGGNNYANNLKALSGLTSPYIRKDTVNWLSIVNTGIPISPMIESNLVKDHWEWLRGNYDYTYFDSRLASLTIGSWLRVPGGLFPESVSMPLLTAVNEYRKPINLAEYSVGLTYHRSLSADDVFGWFNIGKSVSDSSASAYRENNKFYKAIEGQSGDGSDSVMKKISDAFTQKF